MHPKPRAAFTLIELLVVIVIIALLAVILFPVFAKAREKARQTACLSNLNQISKGVMMYIQDYDETFPYVLDISANFMMDSANTGDDGKVALPGVTGQEPQFQLVTVVAPYVKNASVWYCPSVGPDYAWEVQYKLGGGWKKGARMRDQLTTYAYTYTSWSRTCWRCRGQILMGGKSVGIVSEPSRWPMISEEPAGIGYKGSLTDPPASTVPHSGGMNVVFGDGHAKYRRMEVSDANWLALHAGDGIIPGQ